MGKEVQQKRIRKLIIHATNEAIRSGVLPLTFRYRRMKEEGYSSITVCGKPTIINWIATGCDELRFSVWWDYRPDLLPTKKQYDLRCSGLLLPEVGRDRFRFVVGACASFYFDYRQKGILSDRGKAFFAVYVRESTASDIDAMEEVMPWGYSISEMARPLQRVTFSG
ncbi:hypothetical protein EUY23_23030, partial [Salmonella enterica]|nr:hypothetical protein [Salmonella enterica]